MPAPTQPDTGSGGGDTTPDAPDAPAGDIEEILGTWDWTTSDFIEANFRIRADGHGGVTENVGQISDMAYDPATRTLTFTINDFGDHGTNHYTGTLDASGDLIEGTWETDPSNPNQIASSGTFEMIRTANG